MRLKSLALKRFLICEVLLRTIRALSKRTFTWLLTDLKLNSHVSKEASHTLALI